MSENNYVKIKDNHFIIDMMYARSDNMLGRAIYKEIGWGNKTVVHRDMWEKLEKLIPILTKNK